jgi:hypothetical protein
MIFFFIFHSSYAQWNIYDCSLLPADADTAWHEDGDNIDGLTDILSVVDDPDIPGNKLIQVDESLGSIKEMWRMKWKSNSNTGATLVFRCKALNAPAYDRDFDLYMYNGVVRERLVSNNGIEIKFDKSKAASPMNTKEWHIYRISIIADYLEVFVDEDPLSYIDATGESVSSSDNFFRFGDLGSSKVGSLYDWIIWDISGAYPPGQGSPFPEELTGISTGIKDKTSFVTNEFFLAQNFPNPFNPVTEIILNIVDKSMVSLKIYNIRGRLVQTLINEIKLPGIYNIQWNGLDMNQNSLPGGMYFYSVQTNSHHSVRKMTLLK